MPLEGFLFIFALFSGVSLVLAGLTGNIYLSGKRGSSNPTYFVQSRRIKTALFLAGLFVLGGCIYWIKRYRQ